MEIDAACSRRRALAGTRAAIALLLALASPGRAAAQEQSKPSGIDLVPQVVPTEAGGVRSAGAGGTGSNPLPVAQPAAENVLDLPAWIGKETGWWKPPSAQEQKAETSHLTWAPFVTSSPLIGAGFGVAAAGTMQLGNPETTRLSKWMTNVLITTERQYSIPLRTNINLPGGEWNLVGLWRWSKFPSPTWGLGGNTPESAKTIIDYNLIRLYETANRRIVGDLYVGAGWFLDYYFNIQNSGTTAAAREFASYPYGTGSTSFSSSPCLNLLYDDRDSIVSPTRGFYGNLNYSFAPSWLGSDTTWQSVYLDLRTYWPFARWGVLALWSYAWFNFGEVPYLEIASIGSDPDARSGRGYTEGRHRGKSLVYGEAELRFHLWEWLGAVAGVNVHSAGQPDAKGVLVDEPRFQYWYPSVVAGLRLLAVSQTRSNVCLDFAVGTQGQKGFYINFNEAF